jgi:hypothetical protein
VISVYVIAGHRLEGFGDGSIGTCGHRQHQHQE